MFNNNKKKKSGSMNSNKSSKNLPSVNMISEGTHLKGTLKTKNDIRIAGTLEGEASAKGKVIVSSTGAVDGNIEGGDADIAGKIEGEIRVTNKLILRKSAVVEGDVFTKTILAEEGAQINGSFHMSEDIESRISSNGLTSEGKTGNESAAKADASSKAKEKAD